MTIQQQILEHVMLHVTADLGSISRAVQVHPARLAPMMRHLVEHYRLAVTSFDRRASLKMYSLTSTVFGITERGISMIPVDRLLELKRQLLEAKVPSSPELRQQLREEG